MQEVAHKMVKMLDEAKREIITGKPANLMHRTHYLSFYTPAARPSNLHIASQSTDIGGCIVGYIRPPKSGTPTISATSVFSPKRFDKGSRLNHLSNIRHIVRRLNMDAR